MAGKGFKAQHLQPDSGRITQGRNPNTFWSPGQPVSTGKAGTKTVYQPPKGKTPTASTANTPKSPQAKVSTKTVAGGSRRGLKIPGMTTK